MARQIIRYRDELSGESPCINSEQLHDEGRVRGCFEIDIIVQRPSSGGPCHGTYELRGDDRVRRVMCWVSGFVLVFADKDSGALLEVCQASVVARATGINSDGKWYVEWALGHSNREDTAYWHGSLHVGGLLLG
jgi:hypothetical protein